LEEGRGAVAEHADGWSIRVAGVKGLVNGSDDLGLANPCFVETLQSNAIVGSEPVAGYALPGRKVGEDDLVVKVGVGGSCGSSSCSMIWIYKIARKLVLTYDGGLRRRISDGGDGRR